jgi:hypothetical protein
VFTQTQTTKIATLCACQRETIFIKVFMPGDKTAALIGNMKPCKGKTFVSRNVRSPLTCFPPGEFNRQTFRASWRRAGKMPDTA